MFLLAGLGNPGPRYERNRHNIGFMVLDAIHRRHDLGPWRARHGGLAAEGKIDGEKILALKPQTFMNESGQAVGEALRFFKMAPGDAYVLYDEIDLRPGKVKVKLGGGAAGHNGIRSIISHIGPDFWRVRLGIGHPGEKDRVYGHVLGDFAKADGPWLETLLDAVADSIALLVQRRDSDFMSRIAMLTAPPKSVEAKPPKPPRPAAQASPDEKKPNETDEGTGNEDGL
ncbi:MAG: aminoacyl-tRNA hydrolase [Rhodospirillaceae bacterium]|jgi:peptidyl-tRNA hydrolase, PTH1 family|nr:aminoacyl-tRNA hydrolase [Rhodospirillaceae bacterium]MBT6116987.1 aminoacyl-tRNA hydrolase [Rhodospirillaceae bacterium]